MTTMGEVMARTIASHAESCIFNWWQIAIAPYDWQDDDAIKVFTDAYVLMLNCVTNHCLIELSQFGPVDVSYIVVSIRTWLDGVRTLSLEGLRYAGDPTACLQAGRTSRVYWTVPGYYSRGFGRKVKGVRIVLN